LVLFELSSVAEVAVEIGEVSAVGGRWGGGHQVASGLLGVGYVVLNMCPGGVREG
jgi:hypothetical protein